MRRLPARREAGERELDALVQRRDPQARRRRIVPPAPGGASPPSTIALPSRIGAATAPATNVTACASGTGFSRPACCPAAISPTTMPKWRGKLARDEVHGRRFAGGRIGHQPAQQYAVVAREASDHFQCRPQTRDRIGRRRGRRLQVREHLLVQRLQQRADERVLVAEVVVEHPEVHAGAFRDLAHREAGRARRGIELAAGGEQLDVDVAGGAGHACYCTTV